MLALLEEGVEIGDGLIKLLLLNVPINQSFGDFEVSQVFLISLVYFVFGIELNRLL